LPVLGGLGEGNNGFFYIYEYGIPKRAEGNRRILEDTRLCSFKITHSRKSSENVQMQLRMGLENAWFLQNAMVLGILRGFLSKQLSHSSD